MARKILVVILLFFTVRILTAPVGDDDNDNINFDELFNDPFNEMAIFDRDTDFAKIDANTDTHDESRDNSHDNDFSSVENISQDRDCLGIHGQKHQDYSRAVARMELRMERRASNEIH